MAHFSLIVIALCRRLSFSSLYVADTITSELSRFRAMVFIVYMLRRAIPPAGQQLTFQLSDAFWPFLAYCASHLIARPQHSQP